MLTQMFENIPGL